MQTGELTDRPSHSMIFWYPMRDNATRPLHVCGLANLKYLSSASSYPVNPRHFSRTRNQAYLHSSPQVFSFFVWLSGCMAAVSQPGCLGWHLSPPYCHCSHIHPAGSCVCAAPLDEKPPPLPQMVVHMPVDAVSDLKKVHLHVESLQSHCRVPIIPCKCGKSGGRVLFWDEGLPPSRRGWIGGCHRKVV